MRRLSSILPAAAFLALPACSTDSKLDKPVEVATSDTIWDGIAVSNDDRKFVLFPHNEGDRDTRIGELQADGTVKVFPNRAWNI